MNDYTTKVCSKCNRTLPLSSFSIKDKSGRRDCACKACKAAITREWHNKNKEAKNAYKREWRKANREKVSLYNALHNADYYKHRAECKTFRIVFCESSELQEPSGRVYSPISELVPATSLIVCRSCKRELPMAAFGGGAYGLVCSLCVSRERAYRRELFSAGLKGCKKCGRALPFSMFYKDKANKLRCYCNDCVKTQRHTRRVAYRSSDRALSANEWAAIKAAYGHRCVYCGKKQRRLTMDHVVPISKGGQHTASNVVPACHSCNSGKRDRAIPVPFQRLMLDIVLS